MSTDLMIIQWFDSTVAPATAVYTQEEALAEKLVVLETVGWLVAETEAPYGGCYILAASKHGEDWRSLQLIPKANVITSHRFSEPTNEKA